MLWTQKTEVALNKAAVLHDGQYRKGKEKLPFITHPIAVANIVSAYTKDEDVVVAALLHDTLEDTLYGYESMASEFETRVADIVRGVTIPEAENSSLGNWTKDRTRYFENLKQASNESALVATADKLHNFKSVLRDYCNDTEQFRKDFSGTAKDRVHVYGAIVNHLVERIPEEFAGELSKTWESYRAFVESL